jgi:hypothetical protein
METTNNPIFSSPVPSWLLIFILVCSVLAISIGAAYALVPKETKAINSANNNFKAYQQVTKLGPIGCPSKYRLCDYYMASSSYSVFPSNKIYDYVSDQILPLAIKAGARLVELSVYADENNKPVVGLKNDKLGFDYASNSVSFESCCTSIANNAFNSVSTNVASDPFILSLDFRTNKADVLNACAQILKDTCRAHMLDETFAYQRKNISTENICDLQRKLIIVSGGNTKGTLMDELVNMSWTSSHLRRLTYSQASQPHDANELINFNRNHITMVVPDIGEDLVNYNPQILFTYGCQWIMMNYGSIDNMMELYIAEFQENSLVLKPDGLRPLKPKKYKQPTLPDPSVSFQPMQQISPIYNVTV